MYVEQSRILKIMQLYSDNMASDHMTVLMEEDNISFSIVGKFIIC